MLVFDIETDGLLDTVSKVHCINIIDRKTGEELRFTDNIEYADGGAVPRAGSIRDALRRLAEADDICGHNIIGYDVPALKIVYPEWDTKARLHDTMVYAQLIWTNIADLDYVRLRKRKLPPEFQSMRLVGRHSLKAWGMRLGFPKDDFNPKDTGHTWANVPFLRSMDDYCMQDVRATAKLMETIEQKRYDPRSLMLEVKTAIIVSRQERHGWLFDVEAARELTAALQARKAILEDQCRALFEPWEIVVRDFVPTRNNKRYGHVAGERFIKKKTVVFNPGSRDHIIFCLKKKYGWKPQKFTDKGKPQVDETVLGQMPWPEARLLAEYFLVEKRLGQVAEGKNAWLRLVDPKTRRIHGRVNTNGAVTGRMTHFQPNVAQTPKAGVPYGAECRACWIVPPGKKLVGCDAEGLELRALGHYMARFDGGAYADAVVNGRKEDGTDVHTLNQKALEFRSRDSAKTWIYAFLYGAGNEKLGVIAYHDWTDERKAAFNAKYKTPEQRQRKLADIGKQSRERMMDGLPALGKLIDGIKRAATRKYLKGLDGRLIHVRSAHSAPNALLQGCGAIVMKMALVILDEELQRRGYVPGDHYEFVGNIHDEFQIEVDEDLAETIGKIAADSIRLAGEAFDMRCPLAGAYDIGDNWRDTH
ncbi:MAG: DNA polymerase [Lysobacteraceae bacterium]